MPTYLKLYNRYVVRNYSLHVQNQLVHVSRSLPFTAVAYPGRSQPPFGLWHPVTVGLVLEVSALKDYYSLILQHPAELWQSTSLPCRQGLCHRF